MKITGDARELYNFFYNLELVAPGKGEAKKTVSSGKIFLESDDFMVHGVATDDILSVYGRVFLNDGSENIGQYTTDTIKAVRNTIMKDAGIVTVELPDDDNLDEEFIDLFWRGHVLDSIVDAGTTAAQPLMLPGVNLSPDKLRKFSLLEPRGEHPVRFEFVEWADRDIIRWQYGPEYSGVLVILDTK